MTRLKQVKREIRVLLALHHWKATRNLCNTRVQDFFIIIWWGTALSIKNVEKKKCNHTEKSKHRKQWGVSHQPQHTANTLPTASGSRPVGANSTTGWGRRRILFLVPFQFLPAITFFSHTLISAHSNQLNLTDRVKGQFSIPPQESVTFQPAG